jgi:cobalt-zinc-cadmium efflux system membrane fusion protein
MNKRSFVLLGFGLVAGLLIGVVALSLWNQKGADDSLVASASVTADWCVEHRVPESVCTLCNPELIPSFKAANDWCVEHNLPESACRLCNPDLTFPQEPKSGALLQIERSADDSYKPTVYFPKNVARCETDQAIIQFASAETADRAGLTVVPALEVHEAVAAEAPAEVVLDETRSYAMTTPVAASVVRWLTEPGQRVSAGEALAELESPEMPRLKADYLESMTETQVKERDFVRVDSLHQRKLISDAEFQQIDGQYRAVLARLSGVRGILESCGLSKGDIQGIGSDNSVTARWKLRASAGGTLLERKAPLGELLAAGSALALVGDLSVLWIEASVREADLSQFHKGQIVEFAADGDALERVNGKIIWVAQFVDPVTRSATVRAEVTNASSELKAHQYGRIVLPADMRESMVAVPRDAVQWEGCCNVVFVKEAPERYRPHKVTIARGDRGNYYLSSGVRADEMVVVKGSFLLKTELKKGNLGAGCCGVEPKS